MSFNKSSQHTFAGEAGAKHVYFPDLFEDMFLEVQNENVVKYCVYWDTLLRVSIYVTKCRCFKENPNITRFARLLLGDQDQAVRRIQRVWLERLCQSSVLWLSLGCWQNFECTHIYIYIYIYIYIFG